jgi:hypothetical protein
LVGNLQEWCFLSRFDRRNALGMPDCAVFVLWSRQFTLAFHVLAATTYVFLDIARDLHARCDAPRFCAVVSLAR